MAADVKLVLFNTTSANLPMRCSLGPSPTSSGVGSNPVDSLAMNPKSVSGDACFGNNNKLVLRKFFSVSDVAFLDTVTETTFQRVY